MTKRKPSKLPAELPSIDELETALETLAPLPERSKEAINKRTTASAMRQVDETFEDGESTVTRQQDSKITKSQASKLAKSQDSKSGNKRGVMVYLDTDVLRRLDITQLDIKHRFSQLAAYDISRSALIEKAIELMLDDLEHNKDSSDLIQLLSS